ncbi:unnamed protein product [Penicillium roqueforti FM164]|uniref:Genomic scaffold, ProqFM164S01 n=1 Tax=Penicillium roqueforti (strain FM164) TaxID=1365484 RepID=W6PYI4_PENRF|nr:unnamed protein product [Penicillium roqueforti FM164]
MLAVLPILCPVAQTWQHLSKECDMPVIWALQTLLATPTFYEALTKLKNLQTLAMRDTLRPTNEYTPQAALLAVLTEIY